MDTLNSITPLRRCPRCGNEYPATDEFYRRNRHGNIGSLCKVCLNAGKRAWRESNPDKVKKHKSESQKRNRASANERSRRYIERHPDRVLETRHKNADKAIARSRKWYILHKEHAATRSKEYRKRPEVRARQREQARGKYYPSHQIRLLRYRARKRSLPKTFTTVQWELCLHWWGNKCAYCGAEGKMTADHFIPLNNPECPGTTADNMIPACKSCNSSKADHDAVLWLTERIPDEYARLNVLARIAAYFEVV